MHQIGSRAPLRRAMVSCSLAVAVLAPGTVWARGRAPAVAPAASTAAPISRSVRATFPDSLFGRSGKLRFRLFSSSRLFALPILEQLFGTPGGEARPGIY